MISAYRISKAKYASDPLSGVGGLYAGGRWHHKGMRIVYAGQTLSLASVEFFVHFGRLESAIKLVSFRIAIPDGLVEELEVSALPRGWDSIPAGSGTADTGTTWLQTTKSAVLKVPSAVTKAEFNYLINPAHPDAGQIKVVESSSFSYDSRMWK